MMTKSASILVTVVLAREDIDSPWQDHIWRPIELLIDAPPGIHGTKIAHGKGWSRYFAEAAPLELHPRETDAYQFNLGQSEPALYVVLRNVEQPDAALPVEVHLVTASPYEAQDYLDSGEESVEPVAMPESMIERIRNYIDAHHRVEKFKKRKRDKVNVEDHKFGQEPIFIPAGQKPRGGRLG